jgi:hypothetical protein
MREQKPAARVRISSNVYQGGLLDTRQTSRTGRRHLKIWSVARVLGRRANVDVYVAAGTSPVYGDLEVRTSVR